MKFRYTLNDSKDKLDIEGIGEYNLFDGENPDEKAKECICMSQQHLNKDDVEVERVKDFNESGVTTSKKTINKQ